MGNELQHSDQSSGPDAPEYTEKPEVTDEHREQAKKMAESYEENRPTSTLPGSDGTVSGTAVNDWLDDDGNPRFSDRFTDDSQSKGR